MFRNQPLFRFAFWDLILLAALHHVAIFFYLYWTVWWFDMLMHLLGGIWVGAIILWFFYESGFVKNFTYKKYQAFLLAFVGTLLVGIFWEVFEIVGGIIKLPTDTMDSLSDLVMDLVGAVVAFLYFDRVIKKNDK
jgi:hypothetical protein